MTRDFPAELVSIKVRLKSNPFYTEHELTSLEESWARHILKIRSKSKITTAVSQYVKTHFDINDAKEAIKHLLEAEKWQRRIGSYATGAGEGLISMGKVLELQLARAWLAAGIYKNLNLENQGKQVRTIILEIKNDPNGLGNEFTKDLIDLQEFLN